MHAAIQCWQRDRRRKAHRCFASLGGFNRPPLLGLGKPGLPDPNKDKKKDDQQKDGKSGTDGEDAKAGIGQLLKEKQEELAEDKPEKPPAARIVAYSDSEGEDEPFSLTRRKKKKKKASDDEQTEAEDERDAAPSTSSGATGLVQAIPKQIVRRERQIFRAARACTRRGFTKLREEAGWGMLLQFLLLWLFRRWRQKPAKRFELLTLAIALPDAICCATGAKCLSQHLPARISTLLQFTESWARPAAVWQLEDFVQQVLPKKKRRRMLTTISQSVRAFQEAGLQAPSPNSQPPRRSEPRLAADATERYTVELAEMRRILDGQGTRLPNDRFDDTQAELLRFATSAGLLRAKSNEEKAHAVQEGAERTLKTVSWQRKYRFMPPAQLKEHHHMVRWQGTDTEGYPILVIKIAKACAECQGDAAEAVGQAIIGQMHRAMTEVFSNRHGPDKLVVVVDANGANPLQAARNVGLFKQVATTLNKHYPHRLQQLFVVDLPSQLRWVLATIKPLLHPATKTKIRTIPISDPALPLPANALQDQRADPPRESDAGVAETPEPATPGSPAGREDGSARRGSMPETPISEQQRSRRRVRILELPYKELEPKPSRRSVEIAAGEARSPGGILRPALKRSMSAGLIGIKSATEEMAARQISDAAQEAENHSSRRDELD